MPSNNPGASAALPSSPAQASPSMRGFTPPVTPWRLSTGAIRQRRRQARSTSASPPHSLAPTPHCRSPSCVPAVASAPPRSMSGSPCSPTPAASSKPTTDIASPTADPGTSDNHNKTGANAPTSQFPFPGSLQRAGTGTGKCMQPAAISRAGERQGRSPPPSMTLDRRER